MSLNAENYLQQLQALLPSGLAWAKSSSTILAKLLNAFSEEFKRVDYRADDVLNEADPRTTNELLAEWEYIAGLPDLCTGIPATIALRRELLVSKLTNVGGQSKQFYIDLATKLGFTITITEFKCYRVNSRVNEALNDSDWAFTWRVNSAQNTVRTFNVSSRVNEPLASWGNTALECAITRLKPAHTYVQFAYQ